MTTFTPSVLGLGCSGYGYSIFEASEVQKQPRNHCHQEIRYPSLSKEMLYLPQPG